MTGGAKGPDGHDLQSRQADEHRFNEVALSLRAKRQTVLAANIANADTPHYKAVELDFGAALREALQGDLRANAELKSTHPAHHPGQQTDPSVPTTALFYRSVEQPSLDGNTVDLATENAQFAHNALMYSFAVERALGEYRDMIELLKKLT